MAVDLDNLASLTLSQLNRLAGDFRQPEEVRKLAQKTRKTAGLNALAASVSNFSQATKVFSGLVSDLSKIVEAARANPIGDGVAVLTPIVHDLGAALADAAGFGAAKDAPANPAAQPPSEAPASGAPCIPAVPLPPKGQARNSTQYEEIVGEYLAMFAAMVVDPTKAVEIDKKCDILVANHAQYQSVGTSTRVPWYFIAVIHMMESNANFGTHLHNGDSLMHRTKNVPAGRPPASVADPPFAWSTSAIDALTEMKFNLQADWSLARILFRLERYNGFGYRFRGIATPYLWSYSDRYVKGRFVADGVFDPSSVSKQCGSAVMLKRLQQRGDI